MKNIILTEEQIEHITKSNNIMEDIKASKPYCIYPEKVKIVANYLDKSFMRGQNEYVENGYPKITPIFGMLASDGSVLKNLLWDEMKDLLIDKYKKMFIDEEERSRFFDQLLKDWYYHKISPLGFLSVNYV